MSQPSPDSPVSICNWVGDPSAEHHRIVSVNRVWSRINTFGMEITSTRYPDASGRFVEWVVFGATFELNLGSLTFSSEETVPHIIEVNVPYWLALGYATRRKFVELPIGVVFADGTRSRVLAKSFGNELRIYANGVSTYPVLTVSYRVLDSRIHGNPDRPMGVR